jgi:hypothetical protein
MSKSGRLLRRSIGAKTQVLPEGRKITVQDIDIAVDFEARELVIQAAGVHVARLDFSEIIRREKILQAPADGECRATIDRIPTEPLRVRVLLDVAAVFTEFEALGLSPAGTFPELVVERIIEPVKRAIITLTAPQKGKIILP